MVAAVIHCLCAQSNRVDDVKATNLSYPWSGFFDMRTTRRKLIKPANRRIKAIIQQDMLCWLRGFKGMHVRTRDQHGGNHFSVLEHVDDVALENFTAVGLQVAAQTGTKGEGIKIRILPRMMIESRTCSSSRTSHRLFC